MWDVLCHLSALVGMLMAVIPSFLGPLVVWLLKRHEFPSVDLHGKEALNFQISMAIYSIFAFLSYLICIGWLLLPAVVITNLIFVIIASVKASDGRLYRYPLTIRFVR